ncbi:hypothetical protein [Nakamurella sp.]|uniref:hypothetical protein n=1 Tax=Nakamurella sp. TaxID=1869182 RepID=UPI0037847F5D
MPYLTRSTVVDSLRTRAGFPGTTAVFDYPNPADQLPERSRSWLADRAAAVSAVGEPWLTFFGNDELGELLTDLGWVLRDRVGPREIAARWFGAPAGTPTRSGGHIVVVTTGG